MVKIKNIIRSVSKHAVLALLPFSLCSCPNIDVEAVVKVKNDTSDTLYVTALSRTEFYEYDNDKCKWAVNSLCMLIPKQESVVGYIYDYEKKEVFKLYVIKKSSMGDKTLDDYLLDVKFDYTRLFSPQDLKEINYKITLRDI